MKFVYEASCYIKHCRFSIRTDTKEREERKKYLTKGEEERNELYERKVKKEISNDILKITYFRILYEE